MALLYRISGSFALLSSLGALFVIITFALYKDLRRHPTQLVFFLSICDLVFSSKYMITSVIPNSYELQENTAICYLQAGLQQFFGLASIGWSGMISLNLIINSIKPFKNTEQIAKFYHGWVWGLSSLTTILLFTLDRSSISKSGDGTCWLKNTSLVRLTFFIPLMIYFALSVGSLITAVLYSRMNFANGKGRRGMLIRMSLYTCIFIICWLGPLIHRIFQWTQGDNNNNAKLDNSWFMYFDAIGVSIQGFFNAVVWLFNPQFLRALIFQKCLNPNNDETMPLFRNLIDEEQDPIQLAKKLREIILSCCLRGIHLSVRDNNDITLDNLDQLTDNDLNRTQENVYTEQAVFSQELKNAPDAVVKKHRIKDYTPKIFSAIRQLDGISNSDFLESFNVDHFFTRLTNQKFSEGKSGSFMCFTPDNKYLIKTISLEDSKLLRKLMIDFFKYFKYNRNSFLTRFYGSYKVVMPNHYVYLAVMSNVFSNASQKIPERYDLKGSFVARSSKDFNRFQQLGKDLDFINTRGNLNLSHSDRDRIVKQLILDSEFLQSLKIMDYSLLIGIHENKTSLAQSLPPPKNYHGLSSSSLSSTSSTSSTSPLSKTLHVSPLSESSNSLVSSPTIIDVKDFSKIDNNDHFNNNNNNNSNNINEDIIFINEDNNNNNNTKRNRFISSNNKEVYYIGIIDILQLYNLGKKAERFFKVYFRLKNGDGLSSANPNFYQNRFIQRVRQIVK